VTNDLVQPKQNNFIPMQDAEGNRCFVNAWDVPNRKAEGWKVVGDLAFHASSTRAPVEALESKGGQAAAAPAVPADPAADRARVKAIARAADEDQEALADKLIADGVPEADALKALAADAAARKAKTTKPAKGDAEKPAAPQA
jgi:hypothetical protein